MVKPWNLPDMPDFDLPDDKRFVAMNHEVQSVITAGVTGTGRYRNHPQVLEWKARLGELRTLHDKVIVPGMARRGKNHNSPLKNVDGIEYQPFNPTPEEFLTDLLEIRLRQCIEKQRPDRHALASVASRMMKEIAV